MSSLPVLACVTATGFATALALRAACRLRREASALSARMQEFSARLDAAEQDAARAALAADVAESVLVEKGLADEEDLEEVRRQFRAQAAASTYVRDRDGELH